MSNAVPFHLEIITCVEWKMLTLRLNSLPNIWLPTYARSLGLSAVAGTVTVALFNATSVFGTVIMGSLTDKMHVTSVIFIASMGATFSVLVVWGLSASLPLLCLFSVIYGLTAGGFSSTWTGVIREVRKNDERADLGLVFSLLGAGRGIGSVMSGVLSEALIRDQAWKGEAELGYGTGFGPLIVFTGISALLGGTSWLGRRVGWL